MAFEDQLSQRLQMQGHAQPGEVNVRFLKNLFFGFCQRCQVYAARKSYHFSCHFCLRYCVFCRSVSDPSRAGVGCATRPERDSPTKRERATSTRAPRSTTTTTTATASGATKPRRASATGITPTATRKYTTAAATTATNPGTSAPAGAVATTAAATTTTTSSRSEHGTETRPGQHWARALHAMLC